MAWAVVMIVAGALLEAAGIVLIAFEIRADRKRSRQLVLPSMHYQFRLDVADRPISFQGPPSVLAERELFERDETLAASVYQILAGSTRLRVVGVALLLIGLGLATAGNIASVT